MLSVKTKRPQAGPVDQKISSRTMLVGAEQERIFQVRLEVFCLFHVACTSLILSGPLYYNGVCPIPKTIPQEIPRRAITRRARASEKSPGSERKPDTTSVPPGYRDSISASSTAFC